ncbi:MAG: hypothetical protein QOH64_2136 [Acidimicrobiaceae bacterium]|jgi:hypothetical protein
MLGALIIVVLLVIVLPVVFIMSGALVAVILGSALNSYAKKAHEGSELIDLNT